MSQLASRMAGAGWGQLVDGAGEAVSYDRLSGGSSVTGFPKTVNAVFVVDNAARNQYQDGRGVLQTGTAQIQLSDVGSEPQIGNDTITRADTTLWVVEAIHEIVGGIVTVECVRYEALSKSGPRSRVMR